MRDEIMPLLLISYGLIFAAPGLLIVARNNKEDVKRAIMMGATAGAFPGLCVYITLLNSNTIGRINIPISIILFLTWASLALVVGNFAANINLSAINWSSAGLVATPIITGVALTATYASKLYIDEEEFNSNKDKCRKCSSEVSTDDDFCKKCGSKLGLKDVCSSCNYEIDKNAEFCPSCGSKI